MATNNVPNIFLNAVLNPKRLDEIESMPDPTISYIVAMTPRSGSSYLCDVMAKTKVFGTPGEAFNEKFIPNFFKNIPGRSPSEYLRNLGRARKSSNGVSGIKASWFQFKNFSQSLEFPEQISTRKFIHLTRRDLIAQAISLYKATATSVFHTNKEHSDEAISKLNELQYDYKKIETWLHHIAKQESGWRAYFLEHKIFPLFVTHEEVDVDILSVLQRIGQFLDVSAESISLPANDSVFTKVSDDRNLEWADRFSKDYRAAQNGRTALSLASYKLS